MALLRVWSTGQGRHVHAKMKCNSQLTIHCSISMVCIMRGEGGLEEYMRQPAEKRKSREGAGEVEENGIRLGPVELLQTVTMGVTPKL